jgi:hypothetical protein
MVSFKLGTTDILILNILTPRCIVPSAWDHGPPVISLWHVTPHPMREATEYFHVYFILEKGLPSFGCPTTLYLPCTPGSVSGYLCLIVQGKCE